MNKAEPDEQSRLDALKSYEILETPPEIDFDRLTQLLARICETPIATVTLVDEHRQWFKSAIGLDLRETDRAIAFCAHAIHGKGLFVVPDARKAPLFAENPLVIGQPGIRFYAGVPLISPAGFALGTMAVMDRVPRTLTDIQIEAIETLAGQVMMQLELCRQRRVFENLTSESAERFKNVAKAAADAIWDWDLQSDSIWWNEGMQTLFGFPLHEIETDSESWTNRIHPEDKDRVLHGIHAVIDDGGDNWADEYRFLRKDGSYAYVMDRGFVIRDGDRQAVRMVGGMTDHTARKQSELDLVRLHRALQMRNACSELLIRATDEKELLTELCRLALDIGGYRMAWVGFAQDDETRSITPAGYAGSAEDASFLTDIRLSWSEDQPTGRGPGGRTIRSGLATVLEDIARDPAFALWAASAQQHGYRGLICLPLRDKDHTFGLLALYSAEVRPVADEEIALLQALADDLAFGIGNLRSQDERRRIQSAVMKVAAGVSASSGTAFFEQLARNMAEAVGAQAGFVARMLPGEPLTARTIVAVVDGALTNNFDYAINGTPWENLLQEDYSVVPAAIADRFPRSALLASLGAQGYVGGRLDNSAGQPVGLLFVLFREPLKRTEFITSTLRIFAARAAAELERQEADLRIRDQASLLDKAQDAIFSRGIDNRVLFWNKGAERLYGWTSEDAIGSPIEDLLYDDNLAVFHAATSKVLEIGEWSGEMTKLRKNGDALAVESRWTLVRDDHGEPQSILIIDTDITRRKAAEREIQHLAFYDPLTRLPNRQLLLDRLQHALAIGARGGQTGALLFIDLDNFKTLNDTLGHDKGDELLQQVALRLSACVRESDTVARLGGDEFVVMLEDLGQNPREAAARAKTVGEEILATLNQPYQLNANGHFSTPSIGVTLFSDQQVDVSELLKRADLAMYQAKASGRNTMRFFDPEMQTVVTVRAGLEADLRQGLQRDEFVLHYQPQVDAESRLTGAEALVRWQHPRRGIVSPMEFIPLAEETALILPLGRWVLETACAQLVMWADRPETAQLTMAVNVSALQFRHPEFVAQVLAVLDQTGADPQKLKLELTESLLVDNVEETIAKMTALKAKGVGFSLDDFGTGYSSLAYLKRLPLDQLKIDRSFVRDVLTDSNDATIARTIVALGQSLGLAVIAEGVETEAQRDFLVRHNCDAYQGYLFSRPLPTDQFEAFIQKQVREPGNDD